MGGLRLHAIGIDEFRGLLDPEVEHGGALDGLRPALEAAVPAPPAPEHGLLGRLRLARRPVPVNHPDDPTPADVTTFLEGETFLPQRLPAAWRLLEVASAHLSWGSISMVLPPGAVDEIDFALARGGAPAVAGLRHLFNSATQVSLPPLPGLSVGWHEHDRALAMEQAWRDGFDEVPETHRDSVANVVDFISGFPHWDGLAGQLGRPRPDLVAFWSD